MTLDQFPKPKGCLNYESPGNPVAKALYKKNVGIDGRLNGTETNVKPDGTALRVCELARLCIGRREIDPEGGVGPVEGGCHAETAEGNPLFEELEKLIPRQTESLDRFGHITKRSPDIIYSNFSEHKPKDFR